TLTDTVGFVRHLPHQLVEAFRSTLEEVGDSDLVLHVVDGSHPDPESQLSAVRQVFGEIRTEGLTELVVVNKADIADPEVVTRLCRNESAIAVSARTGAGIPQLLEAISARLPRPQVAMRLLVPYDRGDLVSRLHEYAEVHATEHTGDGTLLDVLVHPDVVARLQPYAV
ncbi:MAG: GTPase, partial [Frankiaceae bacterium]|nr:GTPase [Frankiaceae bacterium]